MIEVKLVEEGVLVYHWIDNVTMQEAKNALAIVIPLLTTSTYSTIIDMRQVKTIPSDIVHMRENIKAEIKHGLKGYVILGAPRIVETFVRALSSLAPTTYQFAHSWDEAVDMARILIRESFQG